MSNNQDEAGKRTIADVGVEEFWATLAQVLEYTRSSSGDRKLLDMTLEQFADHMLSFFRSRSYQTAVAEAGVAERILTDWDGLVKVKAVAQPCRIRTLAELDEVYKQLEGMIRASLSKTEIVLAVAIADEVGDGTTKYTQAPVRGSR